MENKVVDYGKLSQFVDALIATKYPDQPEKILGDKREQMIKELNAYVIAGIAYGLSEKQVEALTKILDDPSSNEETIKAFFAGTGDDLNQRVQTAMTDFGKEYMEARDE